MTREEFSQRLAAGPLVLDGATGSNLIAAGMPRGVSTELWALEHPETVIALQRAYVEAGSQAVYAPTFQANRISLEGHGIRRSVAELVDGLVGISRKAVDGRALIAGDLSTTGKLPAPFGPMGYEQLFDCYAEQIAALAGAGVDFLVAETLLTADEAMAILDAAASVCDLPVVCTLTVEADGGLLLGGNIFEAAADIEAMGADAVGVNCSVGPDQLESVVRTLHERLSVPILAKPNAGMPQIDEAGNAHYAMTPPDFARHMKKLQEAGARLLGGCCGTTPEDIAALREIL